MTTHQPRRQIWALAEQRVDLSAVPGILQVEGYAFCHEDHEQLMRQLLRCSPLGYVAEDVLEGMVAKLQAPAELEQLAPGQRVTITHGRYAKLPGKVITLEPLVIQVVMHSHRVLVSLVREHVRGET